MDRGHTAGAGLQTQEYKKPNTKLKLNLKQGLSEEGALFFTPSFLHNELRNCLYFQGENDGEK